jgi:hypothetical protein
LNYCPNCLAEVVRTSLLIIVLLIVTRCWLYLPVNYNFPIDYIQLVDRNYPNHCIYLADYCVHHNGNMPGQ